MSKSKPGEDILVFSDEQLSRTTFDSDDAQWTILIVDDDEQVHKVTNLALSHVTIQNKTLNFLHAYSSIQALSILQEVPEIAVILLDVVMESDDAGLQLVKKIRDDLQNHTVRIILRTGQPGYAPELDVIQNYDINDYKMKSELTRTRLITTITTAVRSYQQIKNIEQNSIGLEYIINTTTKMFLEYDPEIFAQGIMKDLPAILPDLERAYLQWFSSTKSLILSSFPEDQDDPDLRIFDSVYKTSVTTNANSVDKNIGCVPLSNQGNEKFYLFFETKSWVSDHRKQLLRVLGSNFSVGFRNLLLVKRLEQSAFYDELTSLPNKIGFINLINGITRNNTQIQTVAIIDIDDFSELNDSMGHENGDILLQSVAQRLKGFVDDNFAVARIAADTFGIIGPDEMLRPQLLLSLFEEPFSIGEMPFPLRITMGLVQINNESLAVDGIKNANIAMKRAKSSARSRFLYYSDAMKDAIHKRISIGRDLKPALLNKEFLLYYQPQINTNTNVVTGAEGLIRWRKSSGEIVPPFQFIGVAESSGLINEIGRWVFAEACKQAVVWNSQKIQSTPLKISVNVSVKQFYNPSFLPYINHIIKDTGVNPELLEVEITESVVMQETETVISILKQLKDIGIRIAVDDFGTGFSSMTYLLRLPIDRLKIDRSFILNLQSDKRSLSLTQLIINMGNQLGLETIAEGVENREQAELVRSLGCHNVQGYLYAKPIPPEDFSIWVQNWQKKS